MPGLALVLTGLASVAAVFLLLVESCAHRCPCTSDDECEHDCPCEDGDTYGLCTACGAVEVRLNRPIGTRDLSGIGESATYPTGYGCEVCS